MLTLPPFPLSERCATIDAVPAGILDHVYSKTEALRLAVDAAITVLRVDQIIMCAFAAPLLLSPPLYSAIVSHHAARAKQAGGPKAPAMGGGD